LIDCGLFAALKASALLFYLPRASNSDKRQRRSPKLDQHHRPFEVCISRCTPCDSLRTLSRIYPSTALSNPCATKNGLVEAQRGCNILPSTIQCFRWSSHVVDRLIVLFNSDISCLRSGSGIFYILTILFGRVAANAQPSQILSPIELQRWRPITHHPQPVCNCTMARQVVLRRKAWLLSNNNGQLHSRWLR
jgi:hypothetical protein